MYCVKCGVKLSDGLGKCPLCGTPVWNPDGAEAKRPDYPDRLPEERNYRRVIAFVLTVFSLAVLLVIGLIFTQVGGDYHWTVYSGGGVLVFYVMVVLPLWFRSLYPGIYVPLCTLIVEVYIWLICLITGGHWFWSFGFPVVGCLAIILTAAAVLLHHIKVKRFYIYGGTFIAFGGYSMLVELFLCITFGTRMFAWSIFTCAALFAIGLFLILAQCIRPLQNFLRKNFFF